MTPWGFDPAQVFQPVLLMHGEQDRIVPSAHGKWLERRCPSARIERVEGAGHSVQGDAPVELARLIDDFLFTRR